VAWCDRLVFDGAIRDARWTRPVCIALFCAVLGALHLAVWFGDWRALLPADKVKTRGPVLDCYWGGPELFQPPPKRVVATSPPAPPHNSP
jgi:hypothetical protein